MGRKTWKPVPGYDGYYDVSNTGEVRSWYVVGRHGSGQRMGVPRILKPSVNDGAYLRVILTEDRAARARRVHHLVLEAFVGPRPSGMITRHINGNPADNCIGNLAYGTFAENAADAKRHGTFQQGATHSSAKLTVDEVLDIRARCSEREAQKSIAGRYGVSQTTVSHIVLRKTWNHLI